MKKKLCATGMASLTGNGPENHDACHVLDETVRAISERCTECGTCVSECAFLQKYGTPKRIADASDMTDEASVRVAFECSLCELCDAVCPSGLSPSDMFLKMREELVLRGKGVFPGHARLRAYERRGTSRLYTYYALPSGCDTVFFPGCALPGARPRHVWTIYKRLRETISSLGIVLDCCTRPSHDLGDRERFNAMFHEMKDYLVTCGVRQVLVACPNCHRTFRQYGSGLSVKTIYETLQGGRLAGTGSAQANVTVHDACTARFDEDLQKVIRELIQQKGLAIEEMPHSGRKTICCGEGGGVSLLNPEFAGHWARARREEAQGINTIVYCAGCFLFLASHVPTMHILDLILEPHGKMKGKIKKMVPLKIYWNRLRLKRKIKKSVIVALSRERTFTVDFAIQFK